MLALPSRGKMLPWPDCDRSQRFLRFIPILLPGSCHFPPPRLYALDARAASLSAKRSWTLPVRFARSVWACSSVAKSSGQKEKRERISNHVGSPKTGSSGLRIGRRFGSSKHDRTPSHNNSLHGRHRGLARLLRTFGLTLASGIAAQCCLRNVAR